MKAVARKGDVKATASNRTAYPSPEAPTATGGSWAVVGQVERTLAEATGSDGERLVTAATATFTFTGGTLPNGNPFPQQPPSTVMLAATPQQVLTVGGADILVDGNEKTDSFGNKLSVTSAACLQISD